MKHRFTILVLLAMAVAVPQSVKAQNYDFSYTHQGTTLYYNLKTAGGQTFAEVTCPADSTNADSAWVGFAKPTGSIAIPDSVDYSGTRYAVKGLGVRAFVKCDSLTGVTIPAGVNRIGSRAFSNCYMLTSIAVPEGVTVLDSNTFISCRSLQSVSLPSTLTMIEYGVFAYDSALTTVLFSQGPTTISNYSFYNCVSLQSLVLPEGTVSIGFRAFENCTGLQAVSFPSTLTSIGYAAFGGNNSLTSVVLPEGLTWLGEFAFTQCGNLQSVQFPSTLTAIGGASFQNDTSLTSVIIPVGVDTIHQWAFYGCKSLPSVVLPEGLKAINRCAFCYCTSLRTVSLPEGLQVIGSSAFSYCFSLESINFPSTLTYLGTRCFSNDTMLTAIDFTASAGTSGGHVTIDTGAFMYCTSLRDLHLSNTLDSIGPYAFMLCTSLDTVIFPDNVHYIGEIAFDECSGLSYCHLPEQLEKVTPWMLYGTNLESLVVPQHVTRIEMQSLAGCQRLHKVTVPASVTYFGDSLFIDGTTLDTLALLCSEPPALGVGVFPTYDAALIVPCGSASAYRAHPTWGLFDNIIEDCTGIDRVADGSPVTITVRDGRIIVDIPGNADVPVRIYDMMGRMLPTIHYALPTGVYLVKVGNHPAQKVVVVK